MGFVVHLAQHVRVNFITLKIIVKNGSRSKDDQVCGTQTMGHHLVLFFSSSVLAYLI